MSGSAEAKRAKVRVDWRWRFRTFAEAIFGGGVYFAILAGYMYVLDIFLGWWLAIVAVTLLSLILAIRFFLGEIETWFRRAVFCFVLAMLLFVVDVYKIERQSLLGSAVCMIIFSGLCLLITRIYAKRREG